MTSSSLAIDVGGTFTDAILISSAGDCWTDKKLTTHHDLLEGFFGAANLVLEKAGIEFSDVDDVITHDYTISQCIYQLGNEGTKDITVLCAGRTKK